MIRALFVFLAVFVALILAGFMNNNSSTNNKAALGVHEPDAPSSLDPIEYDLTKNHAVQSIVHAKLTSSYRGKGIITPELAISWENRNSSSEWRFKIRSDVFFTNGSKVTPQNVVASFKRTLFLLKHGGSKSNFVRHLIGIEKFKDLESGLAGLSIDGDNVIFKFNEGVHDVPEILSFGVFAVVDPINFNSKTGDWLPSHFSDVSGAGPYKISSVGQSVLVAERKEFYPRDLFNIAGFEIIKFISEPNTSQNIDFSYASSDSDLFLSNDFKFYGRGARNILYARILSSKEPKSELSKLENRIALREATYSAMNEAGLTTTRSFLPLIMKGISEPVFNSTPPEARVVGGTLRFNEARPSHSKLSQVIRTAFEAAAKRLSVKTVAVKDIKIENLRKNLISGHENELLDIAFLKTGISAENPASDIRLMFSREGIWLPDEDGSISTELKKTEPNFQKINQAIADQAIIWPLARFDFGIWARDSLDLSDYNILQPPGELQWIGRK